MKKDTSLVLLSLVLIELMVLLAVLKGNERLNSQLDLYKTSTELCLKYLKER